jgi:type IV pilus assembly protein PilQ
MMRKYLLPCAVAGLMLAALAAGARGAPSAVATALLRGVAISSPSSGEGLLLRIQGDYAFQAAETAPDKPTLSFPGVRADAVAPEGQWGNGVISGYRLVEYRDEAGKPGLRVEVSLRQRQSFRVERGTAGLQVMFSSPKADPAREAAVIAPPAPRAQDAPVRVHGVTIRPGQAGQTFVNISTSHPGPYRVFELNNPARLVVDFEGAEQASGRRSFSADSPYLRDVRVGQFRGKSPSVVRVVADLVGHPHYQVQPVEGGVRIVFGSLAATPAVQAAPPAVPAVAASQPVAAPVEAAPKSSPVKPSSEAPVSAANYQKVLPVAEGPSVAAAPKPAEPAADPELDRSVAAARLLAATTVNLAPDAQAPAQASGEVNAEEKPAAPAYTGEPISVNLKNVDLKDFFRLIHEISGLNIIVDPDVTGSVTMVLTDVPWDQALDIVLKDNGLGKVLEGNVLRIAKVSTLTAEQGEAKKLADARLEAQPLVTRFVPVNYAKATNIATMLKGWAGGGALSKRGNVLVDDRTNTLIVSDIASQVPVILNIIKKLDTKTKQVAIEARVESVDRTFLRTLAGALAFTAINKSSSTIQGAQSGSGSGLTTSAGTASSSHFPSVSSTDQTLTGFGVYAISNVGARYVINGMLAAEEDKGLAQTISKPSIVTQNNVPGKVTQGAQIPIQTTINNTISVTYVSAALSLSVTPQVTADGNIFMVIDVENSVPAPALTQAGPVIETQSATTQVLVPDGGTVIFGGVTKASVNNSASYVPLLGKIPILGNLFKTTSHQTDNTELLFFVSPKILPG